MIGGDEVIFWTFRNNCKTKYLRFYFETVPHVWATFNSYL